MDSAKMHNIAQPPVPIPDEVLANIAHFMGVPWPLPPHDDLLTLAPDMAPAPPVVPESYCPVGTCCDSIPIRDDHFESGGTTRVLSPATSSWDSSEKPQQQPKRHCAFLVDEDGAAVCDSDDGWDRHRSKRQRRHHHDSHFDQASPSGGATANCDLYVDGLGSGWGESLDRCLHGGCSQGRTPRCVHSMCIDHCRARQRLLGAKRGRCPSPLHVVIVWSQRCNTVGCKGRAGLECLSRLCTRHCVNRRVDECQRALSCANPIHKRAAREKIFGLPPQSTE
jgi:hypothetical protein